MFQSIWVYHITCHPSQYCSIHALDLGLIIKNIKFQNNGKRDYDLIRGLSGVMLTFKGINESFPSPSH